MWGFPEVPKVFDEHNRLCQGSFKRFDRLGFRPSGSET